MSVYKSKFNKEKLKSANTTERTFFLIIAHLSNELNVLNKLYFWAGEYPTSNEVEESGKIAMTLLFLRLLAGKLKEGNELLQKYFYGTAISKEYVPKLKAEGKETLDKIKKYFSRKNLINDIRNNYAFHYSPDELNAVLPEIPDDLEMYVSDVAAANTLHYFAEVIANHAVLKNINPEDELSAYQKLVKEILTVSRWFIDFANYLMVEFISKYGQDIWDGEAERIEFSGLQNINDIKLPWFTDASSLHNYRA